MISLQSRFCTYAPTSVFHVDIYSSSLRLFKIDRVVKLLPATGRQYSILGAVHMSRASPADRADLSHENLYFSTT